MSTTKVVTDLLNGMISSVKSVIPVPVTVNKPRLVDQPYEQQTMGVIIGVTGQVKGSILIDSKTESFETLGEIMFGMQLSGEMLQSFVGELGNMIAGSLATHLAGQGFEVDITPPTVMCGNTKLFGFNQAILLPFEIENVGAFSVLAAVKS